MLILLMKHYLLGQDINLPLSPFSKGNTQLTINFYTISSYNCPERMPSSKAFNSPAP
jgi:hypothetical protein